MVLGHPWRTRPALEAQSSDIPPRPGLGTQSPRSGLDARVPSPGFSPEPCLRLYLMLLTTFPTGFKATTPGFSPRAPHASPCSG